MPVDGRAAAGAAGVHERDTKGKGGKKQAPLLTAPGNFKVVCP
jgi:hypothetical protein